MGAGVVKSGGGGRGRRRGGRSAAMSDINITPMVDVMLVLLIIFMVAAPMLTVGVPVELPKSAAGALPTEQEEPLTITLTADGKIAIQQTEVSDAEMIPKLSAIAAERTSKKVFLRADGAICLCAGGAGDGRPERGRVQRDRPCDGRRGAKLWRGRRV
jgi:biopolymer transport protein TolR